MSQKLESSEWKKELKVLNYLLLPNLLAQVIFELGLQLSFFYGATLGEKVMTEAGFAFSYLYGFGYSIVIGVSYAIDTVLSQTYGSDKKQVGLILQRMLILSALVLSLNFPLLLLAGWPLSLVSRTKELMQQSTLYIQGSVLTLSGVLCNQLLVRVLLLQRHVWVVVNSYICMAIICVLMHVLLNRVFGLQLLGSAIATGCSFWITTAGTAYFMKKSGTLKEIWGGWTRVAWLHWEDYVKLILFGVVSTWVVYITYDGFTYLTGALSIEELSVQVMASQINHLLTRASNSFLIVAGLRIGELVGNQKVESIRFSIIILLVLGLVFGTVISLPLIFFRVPLVNLFISNQIAVKIGQNTMFHLCLTVFLGPFIMIARGVMNAASKQRLMAVCYVIVCIVFTSPLTLYLMFKTSARSYGMWIGLNAGLSLGIAITLILIYKINWNDVANDALERYNINQSSLSALHLKLSEPNEVEPLAQTSKPSYDTHSVYPSNSEKFLIANQQSFENGELGKKLSGQTGLQVEVTAVWFLRNRIPILACCGAFVVFSLLCNYYFPPQYELARSWFVQHFGNFSV